MGKKLVKLIGSGIGFTSEAIHAARDRGSKDSSRNASVQEGSEYIVTYEETADALVRNGQAELATHTAGHTIDDKQPQSKAAEAGYDSDDESPYSDNDLQRGVDQDEAVWQLDEAQSVALPSYDESEYAAAVEEAAAAATAVDQPEEVKEKIKENMVRSLIEMAGPVNPDKQPIPCPVIMPQRRPGTKSRGFVRAYAPVLAEAGISQDVFLKFLHDFDQASRADPWIEVVYVAAGIAGFVPETAAQVTSFVVQVAVGTAREIQTRHRRNNFLDRVNQDLFMPRGLYCMLMTFKDEMPSNGSGQSVISNQTMDINAAITKYSNPDDPELTGFQRRLQNIRLTSGKTYGELQLPEAAPLVYPALDQAAAQVAEGDGNASPQTRQNLKSAGKWVQDYMDRKAQASYEIEHPGSSLAVPASERKAFVSRYNDPNHAANNGNLISLLTGGKVVPKKHLLHRMGDNIVAKQKKNDEERVAQGLKPRWDMFTQRNKKGSGGFLGKALSQDVLYMLIVNLPSEEEMQTSAAQLEEILQQSGQAEQAASK